jgi:sugar transferase (PEP-CTERM/EpsH1 system associated)
LNILFVVPYVPSLVRVRPYNLIRSLSRRGHTLTVMTLWSGEREYGDYEKLTSEGYAVRSVELPRWRSLWNCVVYLPTRVPLQAVYAWQPKLAKQLREMVFNHNGNAPFDVIHVEHLRGVRYALDLKASGAGLPIIWDSVDCITHLFKQTARRSKRFHRRWLTKFELSRTEQYEGWLTSQFDRTLVTSPADKEALLSLSAHGRFDLPVSVIPNGVDLDYFSPGNDDARQPDTLVMSGKMSYHANVSMALQLVEHILPRVWAQRPGVMLWIVGQDPPREIQALAENPKIIVTGRVEDIRPYLQQASVAVAPLTYGAGVQNKVLEAMASATPVVVTRLAVGALAAQPGRDVLVADDAEGFARCILKLLNDRSLQRQVGRAGRRYVERYHQWDTIASQLEGVYHEVNVAKQ